jgi:hypothetical protein
MANVRVGLFLRSISRAAVRNELPATLARVAEAGLNHLCVGDHVSSSEPGGMG